MHNFIVTSAIPNSVKLLQDCFKKMQMCQVLKQEHGHRTDLSSFLSWNQLSSSVKEQEIYGTHVPPYIKIARLKKSDKGSGFKAILIYPAFSN